MKGGGEDFRRLEIKHLLKLGSFNQARLVYTLVKKE